MNYRHLVVIMASLFSFNFELSANEQGAMGKQPETIGLPNKNKKPMDILASLDKTSDTTRCMPANPDKVMSLYDIMDLAMCYNPAVREKWLQLKQYKISRDDSYGDYYPTLEYTGNYGRSLNSKEYDDYQQYGKTEIKQGLNTASNSINLQWLLFDFGTREASVKKAENEYLMYKMFVRSDLQDIVLDVAQKYFTVLAYQANLQAYIKTEEIAKRSYEISKGKRLGGIGVLADELQAQNQAISSEYNRISAEGNVKRAMGELAILIGLSPDTGIKFVDNSLSIPNTLSTERIDSLLETALKQHPKILLAKQQIIASESSLNVAQRNVMPKFYLTGSAGYETYGHEFSQYKNSKMYNANETVGSMLTNGSTTSTDRGRSASIGLVVKFPIFSGFRNLNKVRDALNTLNIAENAKDKYEKEVSVAVWQSYQQIQTATRNHNVVISLLETARKAHEIAEGRYQSGVGNILELLNTQSALSQAEMSNVQASVDWHLARLSLAASLGMLDLDLIKADQNTR